MGGATAGTHDNAHKGQISIHAPRGGSDHDIFTSSLPQPQFQSTLPVGGATIHGTKVTGITMISIHAPRGGSD